MVNYIASPQQWDQRQQWFYQDPSMYYRGNTYGDQGNRRVIGIENLMAHIEEVDWGKVPEHAELSIGDKDSDTMDKTLDMLSAEMYIPSTVIHIADLYSVGAEEPNKIELTPIAEVPFIHNITINGPKGEKV